LLEPSILRYSRAPCVTRRLSRYLSIWPVVAPLLPLINRISERSFQMAKMPSCSTPNSEPISGARFGVWQAIGSCENGLDAQRGAISRLTTTLGKATWLRSSRLLWPTGKSTWGARTPRLLAIALYDARDDV